LSITTFYHIVVIYNNDVIKGLLIKLKFSIQTLCFSNHRTNRSTQQKAITQWVLILPQSPLVSGHCRGAQVSGWRTPHSPLRLHQLLCTCSPLLLSSLFPIQSSVQQWLTEWVSLKPRLHRVYM